MTRDRLISLFLFQEPHALRYQYRSNRDGYQQDLPVLKQLITEGLVKEVEKDGKYVTYAWTARRCGGI